MPRGDSGLTMMNGTLGPSTLGDYLPQDPVSVTFGAMQNEWTLHIVKKDGCGWVPAWRDGLIALVVIASVLVGALLLLLLATHEEQKELLAEQVWVWSMVCGRF